MKGLISLLIVFVLTLVVVTTAFADSPDREITHFEEDYELVYCGDFWIRNNSVYTIREDFFFDADGNWVKTKGHASGTDHLYVAGSDKVVEGKFAVNWTVTEDPETGLLFSYIPGTPMHINLPGYGNVFHFAGFHGELYDPETGESFIIKEVGLRSFDPVALCEYLAP